LEQKYRVKSGQQVSTSWKQTLETREQSNPPIARERQTRSTRRRVCAERETTTSVRRSTVAAMPHGQHRVRKETLWWGGLMDLIELIDSLGSIGSIDSIGSLGLIGSVGLTPPLIEWNQAVVGTLAVGAAHADRCGSTWCACV